MTDLALNLIAIVGDLPLLLLMVLSAIGGAAVAVAGLMLLIGAIETSTFTDGRFVMLVRQDWWWLAYLALAILGVLSQSRAAEAQRASMRRQWQGAR